MDIEVGRVVISSAGHDTGRPMLVIGAGDGFVFVADGKERLLAHPKKKNSKHVRATRQVIETEGLTDKRLRQTLRAMFAEHVQESEQLVER